MKLPNRPLDSLLAALFGVGATGLLFAVHLEYPIGSWLIWRYLGYWLACVVWIASCLGAGLRLVDVFRFERLAPDRRWLFGLATGVLAWGLMMLLLGFAQLWSPWLFGLLPIAFLSFGRAELSTELRTFASRFRQLRFPNGATAIAVVAVGTVGLLLVYLPIVNPANLGYDPRWYHLPIAEQYAVRGGIQRFSEGWLVGAYPQLASAIYGWAFLLPVGTLFDYVELSLHLEFTIFVATLASVPVLARALIDEPQPFAWVFMLLFPGLYLYDSNLIGGADHVAAFWAVPLALATLEAWQRFTTRTIVLATLFASAALLTKYTAAGLVLGPGLLLAGRAIYLVARAGSTPGSRRAVVSALGIGAVTGLLVTSPHWLKNAIFYGDPLLPFLRSVFAPTIWVADAESRLAVFADPGWAATPNMLGVLNTLGSPFSFAFWPHDWPAFHEHVPVFGFLYTLTMPAIFFIPKRARIIALYVVTSIGIMFWYWTFHQDRYLQAYLPWMAACVAAVVTQAWRLGVLARSALAMLLAAQLLVGAGVPFLPAQNLGSPYVRSLKLMGGWLSEDRADFDDPFRGYRTLTRTLPTDARILVHDDHLTLGIGRPKVSDALGWQTGIDYRDHLRPHELWAFLRSMGVTHVTWRVHGGYGLSSISEETAFQYFVTNYLLDVRSQGGLRVGALPPEAPEDDSKPARVALFGCEESYDNGVYPIEKLTATWLQGAPRIDEMPKPDVRLKSNAELYATLDGVEAVRADKRCARKLRLERRGFVKAHERNTVVLWVRRLPNLHAR